MTLHVGPSCGDWIVRLVLPYMPHFVTVGVAQSKSAAETIAATLQANIDAGTLQAEWAFYLDPATFAKHRVRVSMRGKLTPFAARYPFDFNERRWAMVEALINLPYPRRHPPGCHHTYLCTAEVCKHIKHQHTFDPCRSGRHRDCYASVTYKDTRITQCDCDCHKEA